MENILNGISSIACHEFDKAVDDNFWDLFDDCKNTRDNWREDIAMEMRHNIMIDVDAFPSDWDMLAEYFTIK